MSTNSTVLVVDDEPAILMLVAAILRGAGYTVLTAPSGREALDVFREHHPRPDLVLSDIMMPDMSGAELAHHAREIDAQTRVLLMTGYSDEDLKDYLQGLGTTDLPLLRKPFSSADLLAKVRQTLEAKAYAPAFC